MAELVDDAITEVLPAECNNKYDNTSESAEERSEEHESSANSYVMTEQSTNSADEKDGEKSDDKKRDDSKGNRQLWILRIAKFVAISFVVLCAMIGTSVNKVTLASITGKMHKLSNCTNTTNSTLSSEDKTRIGSICYIELVVIMIIPDFVSFLRCLLWGVVGKNTDTYPWPTWKDILLVRLAIETVIN